MIRCNTASVGLTDDTCDNLVSYFARVFQFGLVPLLVCARPCHNNHVLSANCTIGDHFHSLSRSTPCTVRRRFVISCLF